MIPLYLASSSAQMGTLRPKKVKGSRKQGWDWQPDLLTFSPGASRVTPSRKRKQPLSCLLLRFWELPASLFSCARKGPRLLGLLEEAPPVSSILLWPRAYSPRLPLASLTLPLQPSSQGGTSWGVLSELPASPSIPPPVLSSPHDVQGSA